MSPDDLFLPANFITLVGWVMLVAGVLTGRRAPGGARWIAALLAIGYLVMFVVHRHDAAFLIRDYSLTGIARFFDLPWLALAGWTHYLAFDLLVGAWEVDDAPPAMPRWLLTTALLLTFAVGPIGFCFYLAAVQTWKRSGGRIVTKTD